MREGVGRERKGEEAVGEVQLAVPAVRCGLLGCVVDGGVDEAFLLQMVVEVAGQVDDESRLFALLNDGVQRLDAEWTRVVG